MKILIPTFVLGLVVFHLLERVAPIRAEYRTGPRRRGYVADLIWTIVNGPFMSELTKLAAAGIVLLVPAPVDWMAQRPFALQFLALFLVDDFGRYWLHRWYHESDFLWRFHRVHHTVVQMDALSTFRVHLLEAVPKYCFLVLPFRLLGIDSHVIIAYSAIDMLKGFWHHANLRTYIGPLNYVFNSAELHWWHHSIERRGHRSNYGSVLSIWDVLFRTFYWPRGTWPERIGIKGLDAFPDSWSGQLASAAYDDTTLIARCDAAAAPCPADAPPSPANPQPENEPAALV